MLRAAVAVLAWAMLVSGCSVHSLSGLTSRSIISLPRGTNLVADGKFQQSGLSLWHLGLSSGGTGHRIQTSRRDHAVSIGISRNARVGTEFLEQLVTGLPARNAGARYVLRTRLRTFGVTVPIICQFRFNYTDGSFRFFSTSTRQLKGIAMVKGTTAGWVTLTTRGTATRPIVSINVFPVDTGGSRLPGGTVWATDISLESVRAGR
jgi:hypothetical protein